MAADPLTRSTVDDLFNDDFSDLDDDPFTDKPTTKEIRDDKAILSPRSGLKRKAGGDDKENDGLGLDEEVKITKKRQPVAKLDEARLLSEPGIPKLRAVTRSKQLLKKLRVKGKGHEFTDTARLLNHFQLWLDNLYPRAKFADALQLVEKAGHTKRMHIMRTEWINEGKPGYKKYEDFSLEDMQQEDPDLFGSGTAEAQSEKNTASRELGTNGQSTSIFGNGLDDEIDDDDALFIPDANRPSHVQQDEDPNDDELDALLAEQDETSRDAAKSLEQQQRREESEGEDDLDALLAEQDSRQNRPVPGTNKATSNQEAVDNEDNEDEDELDALLAEQTGRHPSTTQDKPALIPTQANNAPATPEQDRSEDEEDDLEALLAMQRTKPNPASAIEPEPNLPTPQHTSSPTKPVASDDNKDSTPQAIRPDDTNGQNLLAPTFSSSPLPNNPEEMDLDDLDALLASQESNKDVAASTSRPQTKQATTTTTPRANKVRHAEDLLLSSSPIPNDRESQ